MQRELVHTRCCNERAEGGRERGEARRGAFTSQLKLQFKIAAFPGSIDHPSARDNSLKSPSSRIAANRKIVQKVMKIES